MFPGSKIFRMKDTFGIPFEQTIGLCLIRGRTIEWPSFIESARSAGWWDYRTLSQLKEALTSVDAGEDYDRGVIARFKLYVLANPHPKMKVKE